MNVNVYAGILSLILILAMLCSFVGCHSSSGLNGDVSSGTTTAPSKTVTSHSVSATAPSKTATSHRVSTTTVVGSSSSVKTTGTTSIGASSGTSQSKPTMIVEKYYIPTSVTLTLYGADSYGVTWNTEFEPYEPVVQVSKGNTFNENNYVEFKASHRSANCYFSSSVPTSYHISKAVMHDLEPGTAYTYRCYDKLIEVAGESFTFVTRQKSVSSFTFVHVSDSQTKAAVSTDPNGANTGMYYADTMRGIEKNGVNPAFILHTGDIVEWSRYESYWSSMINTNAKCFAGIPVMAIAGNHEASHRSGFQELFKHFHYDITPQDTTEGMYYAFDYGNAKFIMLDTNGLSDNQLSDDEYQWLENTLKNNKQKWTVVAMHNPMYSIGKYGSDSAWNAIALALREQLGDLFAQHGVDLVLQGHDHAYSRTYPIGMNGAVNRQPDYETINGINYCTNANGVIYAMHGPSGDQSRSYSNSMDATYYEQYAASQASSWAEIEISEELLTVKGYCYNNGTPKLWTSYGIKK